MSCAACGTAAVATYCFTEGGLLFCGPCDASAHGPDSLGADHERVTATHTRLDADGGGAAQPAPPCDICKAADAVLLCCDDRALMCRGCDRTVHGANEASKAHRRLLLSPVAIGFDSLGAGAAPPAALAEADKGKASAAAPKPAAPKPAVPTPTPSAPPPAAATGHVADNEAAVMTMAAELLGLPPGAGEGFTAKDVDAAFLWEASAGGMGGGGGLGLAGDDLDFDADLTALLGLDDGGGGGGAGPSAAPAFEAGPSGAVAGPPAAPAAAAPAAPASEGGRSTRARRGRGAGGAGDGVVPEMGGAAKRSRG